MDGSSEELVVVVHILEAINFHRVKNTPIVLSASLDRNVLETASRTPGIASTSFEQSLVWETDRPSVKRMKTENIPIKVECFAVDQAASDGQRSPIGHLLLPLRSVPLLPSSKAGSVRPRWYRLIGLSSPEWKNQKPEVQLLALVTDKGYLSLGKKKIESDSEKEVDRSLVIFTNPEPTRLNSKDDLPIQLLEERGLLQVGNFDSERDIFLVKIVLKYAKQLQRLIPEGAPADFRIRYELLGDFYPCTLERKANERFFIQEKIVINFRTSLRSLKRYFDEVFLIRLEVLNGEQVVGILNLSFGDLIEDSSLDEFQRKRQETLNALEFEKFYPIEPQQSGNKDAQEETSDQQQCASVKCKFTLKYLSTDSWQQQRLATIDREKEIVPSNEIQSVQPINLGKVSEPPPKGPPEKIDIQSILLCEERDLRDVPRTFSYNLQLQSIRFNARPSAGLWQLSLFHPKADTPLTKITMELSAIESDTLEFPNLQLSLYFSTLPDHVLETITAERSKLSLHAPHGLAGYARLDNQSLVVGTKERRSGVVILENQNGESIGMATVFCFLTEVGVNYNSRDPDPEVPEVATLSSKGRLDDQLSYRMLEEQKQWMLAQRELFLAELKRKEAAHLAKLSSEWKKKCAKENEAIARKLEHASALTAALEETKKNLAVQSIQQSHDSLEEVKTKLELQYQQQLQDIRDKTTRLEADLRHRSKLQDLRCNELEERNDTLTREHNHLKELNVRLNQELETAKHSIESVSHQLKITHSNLQEAEKSKLFYKQQWAKMIREVHKMKLENEDQLTELLRGKERKKGHSYLEDKNASCCYRSCDEQQELENVRSMIFDHPPGCCSRSGHF